MSRETPFQHHIRRILAHIFEWHSYNNTHYINLSRKYLGAIPCNWTYRLWKRLSYCPQGIPSSYVGTMSNLHHFLYCPYQMLSKYGYYFQQNMMTIYIMIVNLEYIFNGIENEGHPIIIEWMLMVTIPGYNHVVFLGTMSMTPWN